jgi:hypothetical protein
MINYEEVARVNSIWTSMKNRCESSTNKNYSFYGGRGVYVHEYWQDFNTFCQWMLDNGSRPGLDLDRIDNDGPYSPDNCRLVTHTENCRNKSNNHRITAWGETKTLVEWSEDPRAEVSQRMIRERLSALGWDTERAISSPPDRVRKSQNPTHCKKAGHPYDEENTYYSPSKPHLKKCKKCHAERSKLRYHRNKEKGMYK